MFTDSLGNRYERLPSRPPVHHAKATHKGRKYGRNRVPRKPPTWRDKVRIRTSGRA